MKLNSILCIILTSSVLTCCTSCSGDRIEVRDRSFVEAIGIGSVNPYKITAQIYNKEEIVSVDGEGETIAAAINNAEDNQSKAFSIGHIQLLVLNPQSIENGISLFLESNRVSPNCLAVLSKYDACDVVEKIDSEEIVRLIDNNSRKGQIFKKTLCEAYDDYLGAGRTVALPVIIASNRLLMGIVMPSGTLEILNEEETRGLCWLNSSAEQSIITFDYHNKTINYIVENCNSTILPKIVDGNLFLTIQIKSKGFVYEADEINAHIKHSIAQKIEKIVKSTVEKTVYELNADVIQIDKYAQKYQPKFYEVNKDNWEEVLENCTINYEISVE